MDLASLLGMTFSCECGKRHAVPTRKILYSEQALDFLADVCHGDTSRSRVHLFADRRTWPAAGQLAERRLTEAGLTVRTTIIPDSAHGDPVCDDLTLEALKRESPAGDVFLAVGAGVINDLVNMISHALDITVPLDGARHDYHGRQVGLGTIFACALYERLFALERPSFSCVTEPTDAAYWRSLSPVVEEEHALKRTKAEAAAARLRARPALWDEIRAVLKPMARRASEIKDCLRRAGAAHRVADIGCTRERFLAAAVHAHQMRERYTVIDLARAAGLMPRCAKAIMDEYL